MKIVRGGGELIDVLGSQKCPIALKWSHFAGIATRHEDESSPVRPAFACVWLGLAFTAKLRARKRIWPPSVGEFPCRLYNCSVVRDSRLFFRRGRRTGHLVADAGLATLSSADTRKARTAGRAAGSHGCGLGKHWVDATRLRRHGAVRQAGVSQWTSGSVARGLAKWWTFERRVDSAACGRRGQTLGSDHCGG